ncbi:MAG: mRNA-degrading endonuclease, partial [Alphaproteobacteria bacterium]|nr:mRNA-degrading endonuclease [Alphaproteobacteria bacterium]
QAGRRPALILSTRGFNVATGLCMACPITHQIKGGAFEVEVRTAAGITGAILTSQARALDWIVRRAEFHSRAPENVVLEVLARIEAILGISPE